MEHAEHIRDLANQLHVLAEDLRGLSHDDVEDAAHLDDVAAELYDRAALITTRRGQVIPEMPRWLAAHWRWQRTGEA
jgi:hypothetical protein